MPQETGLIVQQSKELIPPSDILNDLYMVAKRIVGTPLVPDSVKTPEACFAMMIKGRELGMPMMSSLAGLYVIKGKVSLYADAMLGLVYRDHGDNAIIITVTTDERCTIVYKRPGWKETQTHSFTMAMAKLAGLPKGNPNWEIRPANMLRARCISEVCRMAFADSIQGLYAVEDLEGSDVEEARNVTPEPARTVVTEQADPVNTDTGEVDETKAPITPQLTAKLVDYTTRIRKTYGEEAGNLPTVEEFKAFTIAEAKEMAEQLKAFGAELKAKREAKEAAQEFEPEAPSVPGVIAATSIQMDRVHKMRAALGMGMFEGVMSQGEASEELAKLTKRFNEQARTPAAAGAQ